MGQPPIILGAGPAGLATAYKLAQSQVESLLLERHDVVGGLCRTIPFQGHRFDVGPHRFFTKNDEVNRLWHDVLGPDVMTVKRLTRILYGGTFFDYPLKPMSALRGLGVGTSAHAALSYLAARLAGARSAPANFEEWVQREFGDVLYRIFFKTYTEKVWGIPCNTISPQWAAQRIKGLNLGQAVLHALSPGRNRQGRVKSLVDQFDYPRLGAGQVFEKLAEAFVAQGGQLQVGHTVRGVRHERGRVTHVDVSSSSGDRTLRADHVFSSIPLTELVLKLDPKPPEAVVLAARELYYRDHITVNLVVARRQIFPDNWIYVHAPEVRMARISSYGNFSRQMVAHEQQDAIAVEYFAFAHEELWQLPDAELMALAERELNQVGLLKPGEVVDGFVLRERDSYPTYYVAYERPLAVIKQFLGTLANLTLIGRGGMYRYNNQDHSMLSGILAARNYLGGSYNLWEINEEQEYLEEKQLPLPCHAGPDRSA